MNWTESFYGLINRSLPTGGWNTKTERRLNIITEQIKAFHDRPASLPISGISETQSTRFGNKDEFFKHERLVQEWNKVRTRHDSLCFSSSTEAIWLPRPLFRIHFWEANGTLAAQNDFQRNCNRSFHSSRWQSHIRKVKWPKKCNYKQQKTSWHKQEISSELSKCPNNPEKDTSSWQLAVVALFCLMHATTRSDKLFQKG